MRAGERLRMQSTVLGKLLIVQVSNALSLCLEVPSEGILQGPHWGPVVKRGAFKPLLQRIYACARFEPSGSGLWFN